MNVGRVVRPRGGGDVVPSNSRSLDRQHFARAGRHQHDVDEALAVDLAHLVAILGERAGLARPRILPRRRQAGRHVGVLGVGEDEILRADGSAWMLASFWSSDFTHDTSTR